MARDEVEAAYFTLLRAREELEALHRYEEFLRAERQRLRRTASEREAALAAIDRRMGRPVRATDEALAQAAEVRDRVVADELDRLPARIEAAESYVTDCEREHLARKQGG
ncbi:MAG: hypothetical protein JJT89_09620 [Nitriliruptoraceae bacterium]|nr:hypothetical protein [Nitriliruptoraceae bacterium]